MGIHHVKGFQDPSTYSKYNGGITCCTNFWTPCSIIYPSNVRTQVNCVLVDIRLSLSLSLSSSSSCLLKTGRKLEARQVGRTCILPRQGKAGSEMT